MKIHIAKPADAQVISELVLSTASSQLRNEFSDEGWKLFQTLLSKDTQRGLIGHKNFNYLIAVHQPDADSEKLISGVLVIKNKSHLFHFFIRPEWQRKGIGSMLWLTYLQSVTAFNSKFAPDSSLDSITVNSSDFSLEFYKKLGFQQSAERQVKKGVCFTPMIYDLSADDIIQQSSQA